MKTYFLISVVNPNNPNDQKVVIAESLANLDSCIEKIYVKYPACIVSIKSADSLRSLIED